MREHERITGVIADDNKQADVAHRARQAEEQALAAVVEQRTREAAELAKIRGGIAEVRAMVDAA
jgi:hypothetical protein